MIVSAQAVSEEFFSTTRTIRRTVQMIKWYPIIAIGVWAIPIIYRFGEACGWSNHVMDDIRGFMFFIQGFLDTLVFCYYAPVLDLWKEAFASFFGFKSRVKDGSAIVKTAAVYGAEVSPSITGLMNSIVTSSSIPSSAVTDDDFWTTNAENISAPNQNFPFGIEKHDV